MLGMDLCGSNSTDALVNAWNTEYQSGRYGSERPLKFASDIRDYLNQNAWYRKGRGLYVGCGNGRNYIMLVKSGLDVVGLDVSDVGLKQITEREPELADKLTCRDFLEYPQTGFRYVVSIQTFQHGDMFKAEAYFKKTAQMLEHDGLFFLRVNSSDTDVLHPHEKVEESDGGFTVLYKAGPKKGLHVHFFSSGELERLIRKNGMRIKKKPKRISNTRSGTRGQWSQWEMTAVRESRHA